MKINDLHGSHLIPAASTLGQVRLLLTFDIGKDIDLGFCHLDAFLCFYVWGAFITAD